MPSDELHQRLIRLGGKPFRRVRKHVGETWKPDTRQQPNSELGVWCHHCRTVHAWRNRKTLLVRYEKYSGTWRILWVCAKSGNVLKETGLVNKQ